MGNWVDLATIIMLALAVIIETKRGFGRAVFDLAAVLVAVRIAYMVADPLSASIKVSANPATNQTIAFVAPFIVLSALLWFLGKLVYEATLISAEIFDPLLGGICGILIGITIDHVFVRTIVFAAGTKELPSLITDSALGREFLYFDTYHRIVQALYNFHRPDSAVVPEK
ncbi:MAG: CvpA family protein [Armatimonadetes bacterium]|nr:CvpA family protein [Armatimonadota bacterium]